MKIAVCFSGQARAVEYTHDNIQTHLLDKLGDVDTFFHICDDPDAYKKHKERGGKVVNFQLSYIAGTLKKGRKEQVGKFSAAAKGVKSKRPGRGYPLGYLEKNLKSLSKKELDKDKPQ